METNIHELSAFLKSNGVEDYNVAIDRQLILDFGTINIAKFTGKTIEEINQVLNQSQSRSVGNYTGKKRGRKTNAEKAAMAAASGEAGESNGGFTIETPQISDEDLYSDVEAGEIESDIGPQAES